MRAFQITQPRTIGQVSALLSKGGDRVLMAGGTDLYAEIKDEVIQPGIVIDLASVEGLAGITQEEKGIHIGAMTPVAVLAENEIIKKSYIGLREAALSLATPQLRQVGTVGGNLCQRPRCWYYRDPQLICMKKGGNRCYAFAGRNKYHAILGGSLCFIVYPSDLAPMLIALGAEVSVASSGEEHRIPLDLFYALPDKNVKKENVLVGGEFLTGVYVPSPKKGSRSVYLKIKERATWDFAVVSAAVSATVSGSSMKNVRIVMGGIAPVPWVMKETGKRIEGRKPTETQVRQAVREDLKEARPLKENAYKKDMAEAAVTRAVMSLVKT